VAEPWKTAWLLGQGVVEASMLKPSNDEAFVAYWLKKQDVERDRLNYEF
jgi:hypothetical protein